MKEIVDNNEDSEFRDNISQSYDNDILSANINRPVLLKVKKLTALMLKRQKVIFNLAHG